MGRYCYAWQVLILFGRSKTPKFNTFYLYRATFFFSRGQSFLSFIFIQVDNPRIWGFLIRFHGHGEQNKWKKVKKTVVLYRYLVLYSYVDWDDYWLISDWAFKEWDIIVFASHEYRVKVDNESSSLSHLQRIINLKEWGITSILKDRVALCLFLFQRVSDTNPLDTNPLKNIIFVDCNRRII